MDPNAASELFSILFNRDHRPYLSRNRVGEGVSPSLTLTRGLAPDCLYKTPIQIEEVAGLISRNIKMPR